MLYISRALLSTTPNVGTYYNYILPSLEDWQHSYWGANYPRLQRVKVRACSMQQRRLLLLNWPQELTRPLLAAAVSFTKAASHLCLFVCAR